MNWHLLPIDELTELLNTGKKGLDALSASQRLEEFGYNILEEKKKKSAFIMFLEQFTDFMIVILIIAAIISGLIGDIVDTYIIMAILILNAIVGFIQEYRAEKAMEALKQMSAAQARVYRDGSLIDIPSSELVPGDIISLEAGNIIPADIRFIETYRVNVDESALTGESHNILKIPDELPSDEYSLGDRINMGFKGTCITSGRAIGCVVATGMKTELGKIAKMIQTEDISTPLQKRLSVFGKRLSISILIICAVIFMFGWLRGENLVQMLLTSISLAVAAIPEGLPAIITIALAIGAKRLVKSNALIRKLPAVETLGSVTYICTDKTGTLTLNQMSVQEIVEFDAGISIYPFDEYNQLLCSMALNNDAYINSHNQWIGDSTEVALGMYASKNNLHRNTLEELYPRIAEIPFDSNRKFMTTLHNVNGQIVAITKGAVDMLLPLLIEEQKAYIPDIEQKVNEMSQRGFRVLGYAIRKFPTMPEQLLSETIEAQFTLIGLAGMVDPPREDAKQAVKECKQAGIIPVMITGDHKLTAKAIAYELGILESEQDIVLSGQELSAMNEQEFEKIVEYVRVYARVNPEQKLKIVKSLQSKNQFVAMTGDGVNDAPALKNADIGIAMGINGTEVAKEASHMILMNDNFSTIVIAIKHGRRIFDNILKFIKYIMTGNSGEIWTIFLAPFLGLPTPLLAIHILWINLITDGLPGLALASEPSDSNIMKRKPRNPQESIFSNGLGMHILWVGFLIGIATLGVQAWALHEQLEHWQTMAFTVLCLSQLGHVMAIRSEKESLFTIGIFSNKPMLLALTVTIGLQLFIIYNPWCNGIFKTYPLTGLELALTIAIASLAFWAVEIEKFVKRTIQKH